MANFRAVSDIWMRRRWEADDVPRYAERVQSSGTLRGLCSALVRSHREALLRGARDGVHPHALCGPRGVGLCGRAPVGVMENAANVMSAWVERPQVNGFMMTQQDVFVVERGVTCIPYLR